MEFTKLLKLIATENGDTNKVLDNLNSQKEELAKNFHFINVIDLIDAMKFMNKKKVFQKANIVSCEISFKINHSYDDKFNEDDEVVERYLELSFYSLKGKPMTLSSFEKGGDKLFEVINRFKNYNPKYINEEFNSDNEFDNKHKFILQNGYVKEIYETLLSKEFRLEIDYAEMHNHLEIEKEIVNKPIPSKLKI